MNLLMAIVAVSLIAQLELKPEPKPDLDLDAIYGPEPDVPVICFSGK